MDRDFFGSPVVKNPPSNAGDGVWSLVQELRPHMPGATQPMCHNYWAPRMESIITKRNILQEAMKTPSAELRPDAAKQVSK